MSLKRKKNLVDLASQGGKHYLSAIVLGLNDALVELTGALAGFTIALPNNHLIALAGLTTGVAATLSMAAAEFLAQKHASDDVGAWQAALCTGIAYVITVALLLLPYFIFESRMLALCLCLSIGAIIIMAFTWFVSRILNTSFWHDFLQMLLISFGVAAIAFCISWGAGYLWGIDV